MSDGPEIGTKVNRGLAWIGVASSMVGLLDFVALLIILQWLGPGDYGVATQAVWIFPILDVATDLGLSSAVIQKGDADDTRASTVFWLNLGTALLLFGLLVIAAPFLASYVYGHEVVGWMLIAYGSKLVWQNIYFIPVALMRRDLRFKELSIIRILANLAEFAGKVGFAAAGFGVWCFVLGPLCRVVVTGVGAQLRHPWRPRLTFDRARAKEYASFGLKTSGSQILFQFYTNIDYFIVSVFFGPTALGLYRLAYEIVLEPVRIISHVIVDVAFPAFARLRLARERLIAQFLSFTRLNLVTVMTYAALIFVVAPDFVTVFFQRDYDPTLTARAVRILCAVAVFRSISYMLPPLLDGVGMPTRTFVYSVTAAITLPAAFALSARTLGDELGFLSVAWAWAAGYPLAFAVLMVMALGALELPLGKFARAIGGISGCVAVAGLVGWGVQAGLASAPAAVRLAVTSATIVIAAGLLLAYTQGLSLRVVVRSLRGRPDVQP